MARDRGARLSSARPLPGAATEFRPARAGDVCVLLVASAGPSADAMTAVEALARDWPGRRVAPLHITCDRFAASETEPVLLRGLARAARTLAPAPVRAVSLMQLRRPAGRSVLKYIVEDTPGLVRIRIAVREAAAAAGMVSAYGREVAWNVSLIEEVAGELAPMDIAPLPLFTADRFLVSRIVAVAEGVFDTVAEMDLGGPA